MKKNLSRAAAAVALSAALLSLAGCQTVVQEVDAQDAVTIQLVCQSEDVYQIFYSTYLEGEAYGQGGWADLDGKALTPETSLTASFDKEYFEGKDISTLSMDFSPYGEGDTVELATTEQVAIPAEYGETYTILFTGDEENGFTAQLLYFYRASCKMRKPFRQQRWSGFLVDSPVIKPVRLSFGCEEITPPPAAPPNTPSRGRPAKCPPSAPRRPAKRPWAE